MGKGVIEGVQADGEQNVIAINIFHHHHGHHHDHQHHDPDQDQHLQLCTANWRGLVGVAGGWLENWIPPPRKRGRACPTGSGRPPSGFPQYLRGEKIMRNGCWWRRRRTDGEEQGAETMPSLRRSTANPSHTYIGLPPTIRKPPTMRKPPTIASLPQSDNPPPTFQC